MSKVKLELRQVSSDKTEMGEEHVQRPRETERRLSTVVKSAEGTRQRASDQA